jgi:outer membrane protein, adhesin transport system
MNTFVFPKAAHMQTFKRVALGLSLSALCGLSHAQTLQALVQMALPQHPAVTRAVGSALAAGYEVESAKSGDTPRVSTFLETGRTLTGRSATTSTGVSSYGIKSTYYVYDGGRVKSDTARAEAKKQSLVSAIQNAELDVVTRMAELYLEAQKQDALVKVAQDSVDAHQAIYQKMLDIAKIDPGRRFDVEQAQVRRKNAQLNLYNRQQAKDDVLAQLAQFANLPSGMKINLQALYAPSQAPLTLGAAQLASADHPKVRQAAAEAAASRAQVALVVAQTKPRVGIEMAASSPKATGQSREWFSALDAKLLFNYDAYDGGASDSAVAAAGAQAQSALANQENVARDVANEVSRLWNDAVTREARLPQMKLLVEQNATVTEGLFELFKVGRRTILDLLNAENDRFVAKNNLETEAQDALFARYKLKLATGDMPFEVARSYVGAALKAQ